MYAGVKDQLRAGQIQRKQTLIRIGTRRKPRPRQRIDADLHQRQQVPENIRLLRLPPYAPELNPQEHVWDEVREIGRAHV